MSRDRGQTTLDFAVGVSIFLLTVTFVLTFVPGMLEPFEESTQEQIAASNRITADLVDSTLADPDRPYRLDRECTVIFFESREDGFDPGGDDGENVDGDGTFTDPFDSSETYDGECNFEDVSLEERLGLDVGPTSPLDLRVRLVRDLTTGEADNPDDDGDDVDDADDSDDEVPSTLCIDENSENRIVEADGAFDAGEQCDVVGGDDDIVFALGDTPPSDGDSVIVARRVVHFEGGFADGTSEATLVVEVW